jgi:hypothetical protein
MPKPVADRNEIDAGA